MTGKEKQQQKLIKIYFEIFKTKKKIFNFFFLTIFCWNAAKLPTEYYWEFKKILIRKNEMNASLSIGNCLFFFLILQFWFLEKFIGRVLPQILRKFGLESKILRFMLSWKIFCWEHLQFCFLKKFINAVLWRISWKILAEKNEMNDYELINFPGCLISGTAWCLALLGATIRAIKISNNSIYRFVCRSGNRFADFCMACQLYTLVRTLLCVR